MKSVTIAFIGGGNMTHSLVGGLVLSGYQAERIWVCDPHTEKLQNLAANYNIQTTQLSEEAIAQAEVVVFAVKPQALQQAVTQLASRLANTKPLLISVAAGVTTAALQTWLGFETAIIRCMPNTPAIVGSGASALYANRYVNQKQKEIAESIIRSVGLAIWLEQEEQLNTVTALSGSGPAYFLLVMEALQEAAEHAGLTRQQAKLLTVQTALGTARLALETDQPISELRKNVTSRGGTTERGLHVLQENNIESIFAKALQAARQRAVELSQQF